MGGEIRSYLFQFLFFAFDDYTRKSPRMNVNDFDQRGNRDGRERRIKVTSEGQEIWSITQEAESVRVSANSRELLQRVTRLHS